MKWLIRGGLAAGALFAAGLAVFAFYFDSVVGAAIEAGCSEALGVDTRVGWVRSGLLTGTFQTGTLRIGNPPGFETDHFLRLRRGGFEVSLGSLRQPLIEVPLLEFEGVDVSLETASGKTNYGVILGNIKRFQREVAASVGSSGEGGGGDGGGRELIVRDLVIRDITARIDTGAMSGDADRVAIEIPEIHLRNVGTGGSGGMTIAELSETVVRGILIAVAKKAPTDFARGLLSSVDSLGPIALEIPGALLDPSGAMETAERLGREAAQTARKAGEGTKKVLKRLGGALRRD